MRLRTGVRLVDGGLAEHPMAVLHDRFERAIRTGWPAAVVIGDQSPRLPHTSNIALVGLNRQALVMALDLAGEPLDLDHGYPCRVIAPNRPGVLQTKWLSSLEVTT